MCIFSHSKILKLKTFLRKRNAKIMASNYSKLPLEVADEILSYLEKDDWLNCRLVSKSWNKMCLKHLNKSGCTIHLKSNQIKEYVDLIKSIAAPPILGIKVSQGSRTTLAHLAKCLDPLISCTETGSIVGLQLGHFCCSDDIQFLPVLEKLSPGLLSLHIETDCWVANCLSERQLEFTDFKSKLQEMRFPKLKHLACGKLSPTLIAGCPSLQVLECIRMGENPITIPFGCGLKSLALSLFRIQPNAIVQEMKACLNRRTLNALTLDFRSLIDATQFEATNDILQEVSPYLKALALTLVNYLEEPIPCPMQVLKVLDIRNTHQLESRSRGSSLKRNLRPAILPALNDISFPMEFYLKDDPDLPLDDSEVFYSVRKITPRFQRWGAAYEPTTAMSPAQIQKCWTRIFNVFPNANNVTVQNNEELEDLAHVIRCLVQCPHTVGVQELTVVNYDADYIGKALHVLDNPPRISIALDNCIITGKETGRFYANTFVADLFAKLGGESNGLEMASHPHLPYKQILTAVMNKNSPNECYLKNLSRLRLLQGANANKNDCPDFTFDFDADLPCFPDVQEILHVDLFAKHFPRLRYLELSSKILSSNYFTVWKKIRQIESRYPNWTVNATYQDFKCTPMPSIQ